MANHQMKKEKSRTDRDITVNGRVEKSILISGNHNTVNVNAAGDQAANDPPLHTPISNTPNKLYAEWIGREIEVESILSTLRNPRGRKLIGVHGIGGVGKSALACEVSERIQVEHIFAAIWWTTAKQESLDIFDELSPDAVVSYETILNRLASWLGLYSALREKPIHEREQAVARSLIDFPVLMVLDNLETAIDQDMIVQRIGKLVDKISSRVIVTSRDAWNISSVAFEPFHLKGLAEADAIRLIRTRARDLKAAHIQSANEEQLKEIARSVGYMPLALKLIVGLLQNFDPAMVLNDIEKIGSQHIARLYDYLFTNSWVSLANDEKDLLVVIATYAEQEGIRAQLLHDSQIVADSRFIDAIEKLVHKSLIEVSNQGKDIQYTLHPLTMNFIRAKLK